MTDFRALVHATWPNLVADSLQYDRDHPAATCPHERSQAGRCPLCKAARQRRYAARKRGEMGAPDV